MENEIKVVGIPKAHYVIEGICALCITAMVFGALNVGIYEWQFIAGGILAVGGIAGYETKKSKEK